MEFFFAGFVGIFLLIMLLGIVPLAFHIWALIEVAQAPEPPFGPPWDNSRSTWLLGLAIAFVVPFGSIVVVVLWWTQVHGPLRRGEPVRRPFWSSSPATYPPPYWGPPPAGPPPSASPSPGP